MVFEMAHVDVQNGKEAEFEAGVKNALPLFARARGCNGVELHRTVGQPNRYILMVKWETIDDHVVHFRESEDFQEWRRLVGSFFEKTPTIYHTEIKVR